MVKLLGKRLGFHAMATWIHRAWTQNGDVKILDLTDQLFFIHFADEGDYKHALFEGRRLVANQYLLVQRWCSLFKPSKKAVQKLVVWIRIPELSVELYTKTFLLRAGAKLVTTLKIDQSTSIHFRGKFSHICIEIDLRRKLVPAITVLGRECKVEYEGLHLICFKCGHYGHRMEICMENAMTLVVKTVATPTRTLMERIEGNIPVADHGTGNPEKSAASTPS